MIFEDAQGHAIEGLSFSDGREPLSGAIPGDGETRQETDRCGRVLCEVALAVGQASAEVSGDEHRSTGPHHQGGAQAVQNGLVGPHLREGPHQDTGERADPGGDPAPEVLVEQTRVVAPLVGQEPSREGGGKAA